MKEKFGIDMETDQYPKLVEELPAIDIVITMGCNVDCPYLPCRHREDWGLDDPSGKEDQAFLEVISTIEAKLQDLSESPLIVGGD